MSYTSLMLEVVHQTAPESPIIALLSRYILGLSTDVEMVGMETGGGGKSPLLRDKLIRRINSQVPSVSYAALELFNSLLEVHDSHVLENLILRNVERSNVERTVVGEKGA